MGKFMQGICLQMFIFNSNGLIYFINLNEEPTYDHVHEANKQKMQYHQVL